MLNRACDAYESLCFVLFLMRCIDQSAGRTYRIEREREREGLGFLNRRLERDARSLLKYATNVCEIFTVDALRFRATRA